MDERVPFLADVSYAPPQPLQLQGWEPTRGESAGAAFSHRLSHNPVPTTYRHNKLAASMAGDTAYSPELAALSIVGEDIYSDSREDEIEGGLDIEEQKRLIKENGFDGKIEPNKFYTAETLQILFDARNEADFNEQMLEMSQHGVTDFLAGLSAGFLDPINLAASFVPVPGMGAAKVAGWMQKAGSFGGRTAIRAMQGAASGALGMAMVEPIIAAGQAELQADYEMADSLRNIAFGAIMGGALHPVAGGVGEWRRARQGRAQPWEYIPDSRESEELMRANARRIARTRLEAEPNLDTARVEADSKADALVWDQHMRNLAYMNQITATDAYARFGYELRNGEMYHQQTRKAMDRIASLEKEMAELDAMREMAVKSPELGIRFDEREYADIGRKIDMARGNMLEAQRAARADIAEMTGGNSLYSRKETRDWSDVSRESNPELIERFNSMKPVEGNNPNWKAELATSYPHLKDFRRRIQEWWSERYGNDTAFVNQDNGWEIITNKRSVIHSMSHGFDDVLGQSVPFIPELLKTAKYAGKGYKDSAWQTHIFVNRLKLNGKEYVAGLVVREDINGRRFYNHELSKIISPDELQVGPASLAKGAELDTRSHQGDVINLLRDWLGVNDKTGNVLFQNEGAGRILGSTTFRENALPVIRLFAEHDASTVRHELAHVMRRNLAASAQRPNANPAMVRRYAALEKAFGVVDGKWTVEQEEAFARSFERYLFEGKAPTVELAEAFETIKAGMIDVYSSADAIGIEISNEVRGLFNNMLTVPIAEGKWQFNKAMAEILSGRWADMDAEAHLNQLRSRARLSPEEIERINGADNPEAAREIAELQSGLQAMIDDPDSMIPTEHRTAIADSVNQELAPLNAEIERINMPETREFVRDFLGCIL